jgi:hypothetical protein
MSTRKCGHFYFSGCKKTFWRSLPLTGNLLGPLVISNGLGFLQILVFLLHLCMYVLAEEYSSVEPNFFLAFAKNFFRYSFCTDFLTLEEKIH